MSAQKSPSGPPKPDLGPQVHMTAKVDTREFLQKVAALSSLVDEVELHFQEDQVWAERVGPQQTAVVEIALDAEYDTDHHPTSIVVDTGRLKKAAPSGSPSRPGRTAARTRLTLQEDESWLKVGNANTFGEAKLIDPDRLEERDFTPDWEHDYETVVSARDLRRAVAGVADSTASNLYLGPGEDGLEVRADKALAERFCRSERVDAIPVTEGDGFAFLWLADDKRSVFDLLPLDDDVVVRVGENLPLELEAESGIKLTVAPSVIGTPADIHEAIQAGEHDD